MTLVTILIYFLCGLVPTLSIAFGITTVILSQKHKIGEVSYVEYSRCNTEIIEEYECNKKSMEQFIKNLG